jgi:hypothetical protein
MFTFFKRILLSLFGCKNLTYKEKEEWRQLRSEERHN